MEQCKCVGTAVLFMTLTKAVQSLMLSESVQLNGNLEQSNFFYLKYFTHDFITWGFCHFCSIKTTKADTDGYQLG